jgi:hypothetical protein
VYPSVWEISWTKTGGEIHAHFEPGPEKELDAEKALFDQLEYSQYRLDPNTWITTYLTALEHGTSDSDLHLAEIEAPITERIERLLYCMNKSAFDSLTPRLVSSAWFEEAARVKRRVLAQGGEDHSFFADICETLDKDPFSHIPEKSRGDFREKSKIKARELFLLDKESFTFWFPGRRRASYQINTIHELARGVLDKYEHQPPGSWKRELYDMREDVIAVLRINNRVFVKHFWFLEFTRESPLWNERVLLGAPSLRQDNISSATRQYWIICIESLDRHQQTPTFNLHGPTSNCQFSWPPLAALFQQYHSLFEFANGSDQYFVAGSPMR